MRIHHPLASLILLIIAAVARFAAQVDATFAPTTVHVTRRMADGGVIYRRRTGSVIVGPLWYRNHHDHKNSTLIHMDGGGSIKQQQERQQQQRQHRFESTASQTRHVDQPCILTIDNVRYNVTAWAKAHPGGVAVLQKFHDRDATKAFYAAHHSAAAVELLRDFAVLPEHNNPVVVGTSTSSSSATAGTAAMVVDETTTTTTTTMTLEHSSDGSMAVIPTVFSSLQQTKKVPRWRAKLFTREDPIGVHKYLGIFCLLHFAFRFYQMFFTDPSAGLGTRLGKGPSWVPVVCLVPHALLSMSSLIFHTVPRDRVVGKPMIWQEYRIHNIGFGLRSVFCAALTAVAIHGGHTPALRRLAVWGSSLSSLAALIVADVATQTLRSNAHESTTATMPYWDGCSLTTQKRFKSFYAYCQFLATLGCLTVTNPAYPLAILLAIQMASLLMTLVRKGLLSTRNYHLGYTAALVAPYLVGLRATLHTHSPEIPILFAVGGLLYQLRRRGINKYVLWLPILAARIAVGDRYLQYDVW